MIAINNDLHSHMIRLIVGLGNPGAKHESDRHNAGFWFIDRLASQHKQLLQPEKRFLGKAAKIRVEGQDIYLLTPDTYMNLSGESVGPLCRFHKITPQEVLVVHDELDLKPGMARLKQGGGNGGHNGLKDITAALGTQEYWRLRLGIGHPRELQLQQVVADFVLHRPRKEEQALIDEAIDKSLSVIPLLCQGLFEKAMLELHTR